LQDHHDVDDSEGDDLEGSDIEMDTEDKGSENALLSEESILVHVLPAMEVGRLLHSFQACRE